MLLELETSMTSTENEKPAVVLVHGAYADGSSWSEVILDAAETVSP
jgi:hypothetical protein